MSTPNRRRGFAPRAKSAALRFITQTGLASVFRPFARGAAVVFMLHRFTPPQAWAERNDPSIVRALLGYLRRERYALVDLATLFASLRGERAPLHNAIAFTVDDGYREHATVTGPVFAEFDCPATVFVTTGFLDGFVWFWWDQVEYVFANTARKSFSFEWANERPHYSCRDDSSTLASVHDFTARCKSLTPGEKLEAIRRLASVAEVALPARAPEGYEPMTWEQLRTAEESGMTFAPHTVTHPILARAEDTQAEQEIISSWQRLQQEARRPVPIFAYPNGRAGDFGAREFDVLRRAQLTGAVTSMPGFATAKQFSAPNGQFLVPRLPFPDSLPYLIQQVSGLERLKYMLRGVA